MNVTVRPFGTIGGKLVELFRLENRNGFYFEVISYGASLRSAVVPAKIGNTDVILGYDSLEDYVIQEEYCGAVLGRFAGRIGGGTISLNGRRYSLCKNNGPNHIHGGRESFSKKVWVSSFGKDFVEFKYTSRHMEEGYPGELAVQAKYTVTEENEIVMDMRAVCSMDTIVNLSWHPYFNLCSRGTVDSHFMKINAKNFMEVDKNLLPTGRILNAASTVLDFTKGKEIGKDIESGCPQTALAGGFDHCFIIDKEKEGALAKAVEVRSFQTGIAMELWTTQPCVQFYSGNSFLPKIPGKGGVLYSRRSGFALEAQGFPNPEAFKNFSGHILRAGEVCSQRTVLRFTF